MSTAIALMFLFGALYAILAATIFQPQPPRPVPVTLIAAAIAVVVALVTFLVGNRMNRVMAGVLCVVYIVLLFSVMLRAVNQLRAVVVGLLIILVIVCLTLYLPVWFARLVGYLGLVGLALVLILRFPNNDTYLTITALLSLATMLMEVFLRFRRSLERSSLTDHLCRVWNRRGFDLVLDKEIRTAVRTDEPLTLVFIDLDGFKAVNDERGHLEGDAVLRDVSDGLVRGVRGGDVVARLGGDEFVLLLPRTGTVAARTLCERLQSRVTACGWSYGIAEYRPGESAAEFLERSDAGMLEQKQSRGDATARRNR